MILPLTLALLAQQPALAPGASTAAPSDAAAAAGSLPISAGPSPRLAASLGPEPLAGFVENLGQWPAEALFFARAGNVEATVLCDGFVLRPTPPFGKDGRATRDTEPLFVRFAEGACASEVVGVEPGPTAHHFIHARGSASNARGFESVRFEEVWPGIDVVLRRDGGVFAYDLHLEPGAELEQVALEFVGAASATVVDGALLLDTPEGPVEQHFGAAWQEEEHGARTGVAPRFAVRAAGGVPLVGFEVDGRDPSLALVVDPTLVYATYVGGETGETWPEVAAAKDGSMFLACNTAWGMPTTPGAFDDSHSGVSFDCWVGRLSPDGSTLVWGTYLGGTQPEELTGIVGTAAGDVFVIGKTFSSDYPTTSGTIQPQKLGNSDVFLTRLSADGSKLVWSTHLGNSTSETILAGIATFSNGDLLVAFEPWQADVTGLTPSGFDAQWDDGDYLVARVAADGSAIVAATWLHADRLLAVAVDGEDNVYVAGHADSVPSPTTPTAHQSDYGGTSGFGYAASFNPDLSELRYGTYLGGTNGGTSAWGAAVDAAGCLYVSAQCGSDDSPVTQGAFQPVQLDSSCGYVAKLLPNGTDLAWATYLGIWTQSGSGYTERVVVDEAGNATVSGGANTPGWPVTPDALQKHFIGPGFQGDTALTQFDAVGEELRYSTWFGGSNTEGDTSVALGPDGRVALGLVSVSADLPVTPGAYDTTKEPGSSGDAVVAVFDLGLAPWRILGPGSKGSVETPNLVGLGPNTPGAQCRLALRGAQPFAPVFLVIGAFELNLPLFGGTLVPYPHQIRPMAANASGWKDYHFAWPSFLPGEEVVLQFWCFDPAAPQGFGASNGLRAIAQ